MTVRARSGAPDSRIIRLGDGLHAQVVERQTPQTPLPQRLPQRLDALLDQLSIVTRTPIRPAGTRRACSDAEHHFMPWIRATRLGLELSLAMCVFCTTVEVRDVSVDILPGVSPGRQRPRRRNDVLGWYTGRRPGGRQYL